MGRDGLYKGRRQRNKLKCRDQYKKPDRYIRPGPHKCTITLKNKFQGKTDRNRTYNDYYHLLAPGLDRAECKRHERQKRYHQPFDHLIEQAFRLHIRVYINQICAHFCSSLAKWHEL